MLITSGHEAYVRDALTALVEGWPGVLGIALQKEGIRDKRMLRLWPVTRVERRSIYDFLILESYSIAKALRQGV